MALVKAKVLPNGVSASYWRITRYSYCKKSNMAKWVLELFFDQAVYSHPVDKPKTFCLVITPSALAAALAETNMIALGYVKIKEHIALETPSFNPLISNFRDLVGYEDV